MRLGTALAFLLAVCATAVVQAATLTGLSASPGVVSISADGPPAVAHQLALTGPYRLVIDVPAVVNGALTGPGAGSIVRLRAAMFSPGVARIVIDLSGPLEIVSAKSSATGLTLTLRRVGEAEFAAAVARGRRPLPVLTGGPVIAAPPPPPKSGEPGFELPADMFGAAPGPAEPEAKAR